MGALQKWESIKIYVIEIAPQKYFLKIQPTLKLSKFKQSTPTNSRLCSQTQNNKDNSVIAFYVQKQGKQH
jgi:hypothetical protein